MKEFTINALYRIKQNNSGHHCQTGDIVEIVSKHIDSKILFDYQNGAYKVRRVGETGTSWAYGIDLEEMFDPIPGTNCLF